MDAEIKYKDKVVKICQKCNQPWHRLDHQGKEVIVCRCSQMTKKVFCKKCGFYHNDLCIYAGNHCGCYV